MTSNDVDLNNPILIFPRPSLNDYSIGSQNTRTSFFKVQFCQKAGLRLLASDHRVIFYQISQMSSLGFECNGSLADIQSGKERERETPRGSSSGNRDL